MEEILMGKIENMVKQDCKEREILEIDILETEEKVVEISKRGRVVAADDEDEDAPIGEAKNIEAETTQIADEFGGATPSDSLAIPPTEAGRDAPVAAAVSDEQAVAGARIVKSAEAHLQGAAGRSWGATFMEKAAVAAQAFKSALPSQRAKSVQAYKTLTESIAARSSQRKYHPHQTVSPQSCTQIIPMIGSESNNKNAITSNKKSENWLAKFPQHDHRRAKRIGNIMALRTDVEEDRVPGTTYTCPYHAVPNGRPCTKTKATKGSMKRMALRDGFVVDAMLPPVYCCVGSRYCCPIRASTMEVYLSHRTLVRERLLIAEVPTATPTPTTHNSHAWRNWHNAQKAAHAVTRYNVPSLSSRSAAGR
jgi:hypothetical protein